MRLVAKKERKKNRRLYYNRDASHSNPVLISPLSSTRDDHLIIIIFPNPQCISQTRWMNKVKAKNKNKMSNYSVIKIENVIGKAD